MEAPLIVVTTFRGVSVVVVRDPISIVSMAVAPAYGVRSIGIPRIDQASVLVVVIRVSAMRHGTRDARVGGGIIEPRLVAISYDRATSGVGSGDVALLGAGRRSRRRLTIGFRGHLTSLLVVIDVHPTVRGGDG